MFLLLRLVSDSGGIVRFFYGFVMLICMTLNLSCISAANADEVKIATGHSFITRVFDPVRSAFKAKTGIDMKIFYNDPVSSLKALEKGVVDVAGAGLELEEWLKAAGAMGVPVQEKASYNYYVPIVEKLMIVVNAENRVSALSKEQLKGIFTGKISNWKDVGGDDAPVLVIWPSVSSGALIMVKAKIMDNEPVKKAVYDVESMADVPDSVAATPEAIGVITGINVEKGIKEVAPSIERPLTLAYKGKPSPNLQKLLDFLKLEGKQIIK